jgi:PPP family 3-phenylpropionic acid transporter
VFLPQIVESVNGSRGQLGTIYAIKAVSEIPFFFFSKRLLKRFRPLFLIAVSAVFISIQYYLYSVVETPAQILIMQLVHGPSFGLFMSGVVYYVYSLAPERLKATAQTLAYSLRIGVSGLIGSSLGGLIIDTYGVKALFRWGAVMAAGMLVLYLGFQWGYQRRPGRKRIPTRAGTPPARVKKPQ